MPHIFCMFPQTTSHMAVKDEHVQAYAEYFLILSAIKKRCDAEDAAMQAADSMPPQYAKRNNR